MIYIVENEQIAIQYIPGNGAWTYHLVIPNSKDIKGKWGDLKVSGMIDDYEIKSKNLAPLKNADKKLALNATLRNSIGKGAGEFVRVTLYLDKGAEETLEGSEMIVACLHDAQVLHVFEALKMEEQQEIIALINATATEKLKVDKIVKLIAQLELLT